MPSRIRSRCRSLYKYTYIYIYIDYRRIKAYATSDVFINSKKITGVVIAAAIQNVVMTVVFATSV